VGVAQTPEIRDDAGSVLTPAKVDAWLGYQRQMLATLDAGALDRARRERALRLDAGLTEDDIDHIEDVVAAIATARTLATLTGSDAVREFEAATASLTPAQKLKAEEAMREVRARSSAASSLEAEKALYGAESVKAVLAREAQVIKTWDTLVEGGKGK
jgi:hypothetical protein